MMYFWLIPALVLFVLLVWWLYYSATRRAPHKTDGRTIVDKTNPGNESR